MSDRGRINKIAFWFYQNSLGIIHIRVLRERLAAYEKFTGLNSSQLRHKDDIIPIGEELKEWREKYITMMRERNYWKLKYEERDERTSTRN